MQPMSSLRLDPTGTKLVHNCHLCCFKRDYFLNNANDNFDFTSIITTEMGLRFLGRKIFHLLA